MNPHRVDVRLARHDRSTLLALVAVLHRRGVAVVAAELSPADDALPAFTATFVATERRAATVTASLRGLVDVQDVTITSLTSIKESSDVQ